MKLYFMPGACSLAVHIGLRETALPFDLVKVDYASRKTSDGFDYRQINPKGSVPALLLSNGEVLTEVQVLLTHIDGVSCAVKLLPSCGFQRLRASEWLSYIATEIHKSFSPLFRPQTPFEFLNAGRKHLADRLQSIEAHLHENTFLLGESFSAPDAYLYTLCRWLPDQGFNRGDWPNLTRHNWLVSSRASVQAALKAEGLVSRGGMHMHCGSHHSQQFPSHQATSNT